MRDFSLGIYKRLLCAFLDNGYDVETFEAFMENPGRKVIILRHDVDRLPGNSLKTARIEHEMGIKGTYYFRVVPESYDENIITKIAELGHEVEYHYENLSGTMNDLGTMKDDWRLMN